MIIGFVLSSALIYLWLSQEEFSSFHDRATLLLTLASFLYLGALLRTGSWIFLIYLVCPGGNGSRCWLHPPVFPP
jgi:hypothetical protein